MSEIREFETKFMEQWISLLQGNIYDYGVCNQLLTNILETAGPRVGTIQDPGQDGKNVSVRPSLESYLKI